MWTPPADEQIDSTSAAWTPPADEQIGEPEKSLSGFATNTKENLGRMINPVNIATGLAGAVHEAAYQLPSDLTETLANKVAGTVSDDSQGEAPMEKRVRDIAESEAVQHPVDYAYKNPIDAASTLAAPLGAFNPEEALGTMGKYAKRFGQNQAMKAAGAIRGQIGELGVDESRALAQGMLDKGLLSPLTGPIGMEEKVADIASNAGKNIGDLRKAAEAKAPAPSMAEILKNVKDQLIDKYSSGSHKGELGGLNKAREEVAKGGTGTFTGNADKATDLNKFAAKNAIYRPTTASSDVADVISRTNNEALQKALSPQQYNQYETALKDYGNMQKVKQFLLKGEGREMTGRGGSSIGKTIYDKTMDSFGNRTAAVTGNAVGKILQNPVVAKYIPALVKAASTGDAALAATHDILKKKDPAYAAALE